MKLVILSDHKMKKRQNKIKISIYQNTYIYTQFSHKLTKKEEEIDWK